MAVSEALALLGVPDVAAPTPTPPPVPTQPATASGVGVAQDYAVSHEHMAVALQVLHNTKALFQTMTGLSKKTELKKYLINALFRGIRHNKPLMSFVASHVLPTIPLNTILSYLNRSHNPWESDLFKSKECKTKPKPKNVGEVSIARDILVQRGVFEQRSGSSNSTLFYSQRKDEIHASYRDHYELVKAEARKRGIVVPQQPRSL
jgi:hypothetical protein